MSNSYKYDIGISFAGIHRDIARVLAERLRLLDYTVFFDEHSEHELWGSNGKEHFGRVFGHEVKYCVVLISNSYDKNSWTSFEREILESRQLNDRSNFLLPVMMDDHRPDWLPATRIYFDLATRNLDELISLLCRRIPNRLSVVHRPKLEWIQQIGIGTWKSHPIVLPDRVIIPTAGTRWNEADEADGIYSLNKADGKKLWMFHTTSDANSILRDGELLYVGTDNGSVFCLNIHDGSQVWAFVKNRNSVLAKPLMTPQGVMVCDVSGRITILDPKTGRDIAYTNAQGGIVADPIVHNNFIYVVTNRGWIYELPFERPVMPIGGYLKGEHPKGRSAILTYESQFEPTGTAPCGFHATPIIWGHLIVLPYSRYTMFTGIPLTAFDPHSFHQVWYAAQTLNPKQTPGNIRTSPVIIDNVLVTALAYSNEIVGVDRSGATVWERAAGRSFFPAWGGPARFNGDAIVPRYDGFIHSVAASTGARQWSMYLGNINEAGKFLGPQEELPGSTAHSEWRNSECDPLNSPVEIDGNELFTVTSGGVACKLTL